MGLEWKEALQFVLLLLSSTAPVLNGEWIDIYILFSICLFYAVYLLVPLS